MMDSLQLLQVVIAPELRLQPNLYEDWMLLVFLIAIFNIAYVRITYQRRLQRLFSSLLRLQILRQIMREELVFSHRASILLFLNFVMLSSLILYLAFKYYGWPMPFEGGVLNYLICSGGIAGLYYGKLAANKFLRWLLRDQGLMREYLFEVFLVNKVAGIVALPIALALVFFNVADFERLLWLVVALAFLFLAYRLLQGLRMTVGQSVSWVYIILYLCTLEITPFLILIKVFQRGLS